MASPVRGKTQVYIRLMESHLRSGKQVLYLLPEIALTAQIIRRLQKHFGGHIAIYHSKFNDQERVEIWNRVRSGDTRIVIGARSALFLPFHDLGLVIVDEEHDASYKQYEPSPRYHARDSAVYYASLLRRMCCWAAQRRLWKPISIQGRANMRWSG